MCTLPATPDFDDWPVVHRLTQAQAEGAAVHVTWDDGKTCAFHAFFLRENSPDDATIHPVSRESVISPLDLPEALCPQSAGIDDTGSLTVTWSHGGHVSRFHPGWLRAHGWFDDAETGETRTLWTAETRPEPPTFDGPEVLAKEETFLVWLEAVRDFGVARLQHLPLKDGLLESVVERIGPIRESNFGRSYTLEIKDAPDSNAFTSDALLQHMDMPTRECPHGLQFLHCRANTTTGGEGIYTDAYRIAEDMRREEPEHFASLTSDIWTFNNRSRTSDYRAAGPIFEIDRNEHVTGVRYTPWLRAPLKAPLDLQARAYRAVRAFAARAQDPAYQMVFAYRPGDLVAFDNRRVLHGRRGYDAAGGTRFIEGTYADRDDLRSAIGTLRRNLSKRARAHVA